MCGIFGVARGTQPTLDLAELRRARDTLIHRGPDHQADWHNEHIYISHTRLSIVDLSRDGHQPMVSDDNQTVLAVNGEIYNFVALRNELKRDHSFRSQSDSEVLLHGYRQWGIDELARRIDGMYAFSLYDASINKLFLVRDRVGIKPLYYSEPDPRWRFAWASELKALQHHLRDDLHIDHSALYDYLTYLYVPSPKSLYLNIKKLLPGHILEYDLSSAKLSTRRYWNLDTTPATDPQARANSAAQLYERLQDAVSSHLVADAPLGFFLSGGVDSSAVVALAAKQHKQLNTYAIGFDADPESELRYAQLVAEQLGANHHAATLAETAAAQLVEALPQIYDEPFADSSALPTYLVAQHAARDLKVALSGDGGDELFNGYPRYTPATRARMDRQTGGESSFLGRLKSNAPAFKRAIRAYERTAGLNGFAYYTRLLGGLTYNEKAQYRAHWQIPSDYDDYWHFRNHYDSSLPGVKALQVLDFHTYLPDGILTKVDRASMAHSLEVRVPLLDRELVEYSFRLSADTIGTDKALFKSTIAAELPAQIIDRPKRGFGAPAHSWRSGIFNRKLSRAEHLLEHFCPGELPAVITQATSP